MKFRWLMFFSVLITALAFSLATLNAEAGSSKKAKEMDKNTQQSEEYKYQQSGQPLYFDPDKMKGKGIDDSAPYSDPYYGKEEKYQNKAGRNVGPSGQVEDTPDVKVIQGPVRYERVKE